MREYINHNFFLLINFVMNVCHPSGFIVLAEDLFGISVYFYTIYSALYITVYNFMYNVQITYNEIY